VTLLARASAEEPEAESFLGQVLPRVADFISGLDASAETLTAVLNAIPYPTIILAQAAAALTQRIMTLLPREESPATRAYWLTALGARLWELGRRGEALPVFEEALAIRRQLADLSPDRYRPDLAQSLNNLGAALSELGRPADALPVAEEAVAIRRQLADLSPDRYRPDLAKSLANLADVCTALDRDTDADAARNEASKLRQRSG
jgi:tetratricopeptide (TPR) repeat protein